MLKQEYSTPSCFDASVLFQETEVEVVLPTDIVGEGWKFVPSANPLKVSMKHSIMPPLYTRQSPIL